MSYTRIVVIMFLTIWILSAAGAAVTGNSVAYNQTIHVQGSLSGTVFNNPGSMLGGHEPLQIFMPSHGGLMDPDRVISNPGSGPGDLYYFFNKFNDVPDLILHNITDSSYEVWFVYTPGGPTSGENVGQSTAFYFNKSFVAYNPSGYYSGSGRWPDSMKYTATIVYDRESDAQPELSVDPNGVSVNKTIFPRSIKSGKESRVTIMLSNNGQFPVHDIEILDTVPQDLSVTSGTVQYAFQGVIEPNETRTLVYTIMPQKAGKYILDPVRVMYADQQGTYYQIRSNKTVMDVIEPLISPASDQGFDIFVFFKKLFSGF
jgi:uncharacterized repeat protein (TIGR01451 family)